MSLTPFVPFCSFSGKKKNLTPVSARDGNNPVRYASFLQFRVSGLPSAHFGSVSISQMGQAIQAFEE